MSARIRGAQTELQELGEEEDQYTKSTSKMRESIKAMTGFDIMKDEAGTEFKDIYDIVVGIGEQWDRLNDITRASLLEMIGGKRGVNSLAAVMNNIDRVKEIYNTAVNAENSATIENEAYQQSVQASIDKTKAQLQELAHDFLRSDTLKGLIDGARVFLGIVDQIVSSLTTVGTLIAGLGAGSLFKGTVLKQDSFVTDLFKDFVSIGRNKSYTLNSMVSRGVSDEKIVGKLKNMGGFDAAKEALEGVAGLNPEKKVELIRSAFEGASVSAQEFADATVAANNSLTITSKLTKGVDKVKDAFFGLGKFISKNKIPTAATLAVGIGVAAYTIYKKQQEAIKEQGIQSARNWESQKKSLESYAEKYQSLRESLSGAASDEEALGIKMQLLDLQKEIVAQYGAQASRIDLVNGKLNTELGIMQNISEQQAKTNLEENFKSYKQAFKKFDMTRYRIPIGTLLGRDQKEVEDLINGVGAFTIKGFGADLDNNQEFQLSFKEGTSYSAAKEAITQLRSQLNDLVNDSGNGYASSILSWLDDLDAKINESTDDYLETYEAAIDQLVYTVGKEDKFQKLSEASEKLTEAVLSADPKAVDEAKSTYETAYQEVVDAIGEGVSFDYNGVTLFAPKDYFEDTIKEATSKFDETQLDFFYRSNVLSGDNISETNPYKDRANDIKKWADIIKASGMDAVDAELEIQNAMDNASVFTDGFTPYLTEEQAALLNLRSALGIATDGTSEYLNVLSNAGVVLASTEQQNDALANSFESTKSSIEDSIKSLSALPAIVTEGLSRTGLSADSLQSFRAIFGDDAEKALERTANGIKINRDAFEALQRSYTSSKLAEFNKELQTQQENLDEVNKKMWEASSAAELTQLQTDRSNAQNRINELKDLISMYEGATSAHNQWMQAQSIGEDRDLYESVFGPYDDYKKELDAGKWADDELRAYVGMMTGMKDVSLATAQEIRDAFNGMSKDLEGTSYSLMDFYDEADGTVTSKGVDNFLKAVHETFGNEFAKQAKDGSWEFDFSPEHVEAIMDAWPIGQTPIDAIIAAMPDAGYRVNPDGAGKITPKQRAYDSKKYLESKLGDEYNLKDIEISALEGNKDAISDALKVFDGLLQGFGDLDLDKKGFDSIINNLSYLRELNGEYGLNAEENAAYQTIMGGYAEDARAYLQHHTGSDFKFSEIDLGDLDGNIDKINSTMSLTQRYLDNFGETDPEGFEAATLLMEHLTSLKTQYEESLGGYQTAMEEKRKGEELAKKHAEEAGEETPETFEEHVSGALDKAETAVTNGVTTVATAIETAGSNIVAAIIGKAQQNKEIEATNRRNVEVARHNKQVEATNRKNVEVARHNKQVEKTNRETVETARYNKQVESGKTGPYKHNKEIESNNRFEVEMARYNKSLKEQSDDYFDDLTSDTITNLKEGVGNFIDDILGFNKPKETTGKTTPVFEGTSLSPVTEDTVLLDENGNQIEFGNANITADSLTVESEHGKHDGGGANTEQETTTGGNESEYRGGKTADEGGIISNFVDNLLNGISFSDFINGLIEQFTLDTPPEKRDGGGANTEPTTTTPGNESEYHNGEGVENANDVVINATGDVTTNGQPEKEEPSISPVPEDATFVDEQGNEVELGDATIDADAVSVNNSQQEDEGFVNPADRFNTFQEMEDMLNNPQITTEYTNTEPTKQTEEYGEAVEDVGDQADDATGHVENLGNALLGVATNADAVTGQMQPEDLVQVDNGVGTHSIGPANPSAQSPTQQYETVAPQEQVVKIRVDSEEAVKGVRDLAQEIQGLDGETQASIGINTEEAQAAIENLASISDTDIEAGVTINQEDLDVLESAIGAMSDDVKMQVGLDTAEVDQYIGDEHNTDGKVIFSPEDSAVQSYSAPTKSGTVYYSIAPMDWSSLEVPAQYKNQTITIHVNRVDNGTNGTKKVDGTAHASGTWGVKNDEDSLINEVGEEIIVRDGKWFTVNNGDPSFVHLKRNDIVFNHKQTEDLFKHGFVTGSHGKFVGRSRAGGQNNDFNEIGKEIARGIEEGLRLKTEGSGHGLWDDTGDNNNNNNNNNNGGSGGGGDSGGSGDGGSGGGNGNGNGNTSNSDNKKDKEKIDWIEVLLERLSETLEELKRAAERMDKYTDKIDKLNKAIEQVYTNIDRNEAAYKRYMAEANKVRNANKKVLTDDIINKIQNGSLDITEYNEETRNKISEYQQWYDKARAVKDTITDLNEELAELASQKLDSVVDYFDSFTNLYDAYSNRSNAINEYFQALRGWGNQASLDRMANEQKRTIKDRRSEYQAYLSEYNKQIANGQIVRGSTRDNEAKAQLQEILAAITEAETELINIQKQVKEIATDHLAAVVAPYDTQMDYYGAVMSRWQAGNEEYANRTGQDNAFMVQQQALAQLDQIRQAQARFRAYQRTFNQEVAAGRLKEGDQEYTEGLAQLQKYSEEIINARRNLAELNEQIRQTNWTNWNKGIEKLEHIQNTISSIGSLISDFNTFNPNSFSLSDYGAAQLTAYSADMLQARKEVAEYAAAIEQLNKEYKNHELSYADYTKLTRENYEKELAAAQKVQSARKSILDTVRKGIEAETNAMSELISKRKEALQRQKEADDYARTVRDKNNEINKIRQQITALSGDTTQATRARVRQLQAELAEKEKDLEDTRREHEYSVRTQALDDEMTVFKEAQDKRTELLSSNLEYQNKVIRDALKAATNDIGSISDVWKDLAKELGITLPQALTRNPRYNANESQKPQEADTHFGNNQQTPQADKERKRQQKERDQANYAVAKGAAETAAKNVRGAKKNLDIARGDLAAARAQRRQAYTYIVNKDGTEFREYASKHSKVIAKLKKGTEVVYTGTKSEGFFNVNYKKKSGWIDMKCLTPKYSSAERTQAAKNLASAQAKYDARNQEYKEAVANYETAKKTRDNLAKEVAVKYKATAAAVLRKSADGKSAVLANIAKGATVEYENQNSGYWRKVTYYDSKKKKKLTGWVHAKNLQRLASGTKSARGGLALTDEQGIGTEIVLTNKGTFRQLNAGDMVFNKAQKENLWKMSKLDVSAMMGNIRTATPAMTIQQTYGSLLTVNGNVDRDALPELKTILNMAVAQTKKELADTMVRNGFAKR